MREHVYERNYARFPVAVWSLLSTRIAGSILCNPFAMESLMLYVALSRERVAELKGGSAVVPEER